MHRGRNTLLLIIAFFSAAAWAGVAPNNPGRDDAMDPVDSMLRALASGHKRSDLVVYNRVPKTGSSTLQLLLDGLSTRHAFKAMHFVTPPGIDCSMAHPYPCISNETARLPGAAEVSSFTRSITRLATHSGSDAAMVDYHFNFIRFSAGSPPSPSSSLSEEAGEAGGAQPLYINTVREPVPRLLSQYQYLRFGSRASEKRRQAINMFGELSIDQCMGVYSNCSCEGTCSSAKEQECTRRQCQDLFQSFNSQMMYFCPWGEPACAHKDEAALEMAISTLQQQYDVVAVLERLPESLQLLEAVLPRYFGGASRGIKRAGGALPAQRRTRSKNRPSEASLEALRRLNALDHRFYLRAVALLETRLSAALASPRRRALQVAMRRKGRAAG